MKTKTMAMFTLPDPTTLDYTISSKAATHDITTNVVDGLIANDKYGNLRAITCRRLVCFKDGLTLYLQNS